MLETGIPFTCDQIITRLWQGSDPPKGSELAARGVDILVLCALELQHDPSFFPEVRVLRAPMDDTPIVPIEIATRTAQQIASLHAGGARILVCCAQGRNRSGLVSALTLWYLTGKSGRRCAEHVVSHRENALTNRAFRKYLEQLLPRGLARRKAPRPGRLR